MSPASIDFGGHQIELHQSGALYWHNQHTLVISDLHFEKGSHFLKKRMFLPPYDTAETLSRLEVVIGHYKPKMILLLGDVFHDMQAYSRMSDDNRAWFERLLGHENVTWIEGNHDIGIEGRRFAPTHAQDGLWFRHIASNRDVFEISGHYHPAATIRHKGTKVRAPCFVVNEQQILMPSFGAYTGGLDIIDPAMASFLKAETRLFLLGQDRVYEAPIEKLTKFA